MQDLKVAGIQYSISWKDKEANFRLIEEELTSIGEQDLIVLPEMFQTGFCFDKEELAEDMESSKTISWMRHWAGKTRAVLTGSLIIKEGDSYFNRLIWMRPDGEYSTYDKRHLFSMSDEPKHFTAGGEKLFTELKGWKICPMVCYDLRFPVWIRNTNGYDVLIMVANWPERRSVHWEKLLQARAIENQCYVIGVNRVGDDGNGIYHDGRSAIIDTQGNVMYEAIHDQAVLKAVLTKEELTKTRRYMPFLKDADRFEIGD